MRQAMSSIPEGMPFGLSFLSVFFDVPVCVLL